MIGHGMMLDVAKPRNTDRGATKVKGLRVSDELWDRVAEVAEANGSNRSDEIRRLLAEYVGDPSLSGLAGSEMDRRSAIARGSAEA